MPDELFDRLLPLLSWSKLRVLLYTLRRTYGFNKDFDEISFSQFLYGIVSREGRRLDFGCGVKNRTALSYALPSLERKRVIQSAKETSEHGEKRTTIYCLRYAPDHDLSR